jgi:hypothetical protein
MPGAGLSCRRSRKASLGKPTFQPYWGKPAVRNDREDRGNVGIIRSPLRASVLPDSHSRTFGDQFCCNAQRCFGPSMMCGTLATRLEGHMRRRDLIALLGSAAAWPVTARAQQPAMPTIGYLSPRSPDVEAQLVAAFRRGKHTGLHLHASELLFGQIGHRPLHVLIKKGNGERRVPMRWRIDHSLLDEIAPRRCNARGLNVQNACYIARAMRA